MTDIAGIPYVAARFDNGGTLNNPTEVAVPAGTTDLFVISHGWNNSDVDAEKLYRELFENFAAVAPDLLTSRKLAIVGVIWPSKKFTDIVAAAAAAQGGAVGLAGSSGAADETIKAKLDAIATMFGPEAAAKIEKAKKLISKLESDPAARDEFVNELRGLLDSSAAHEEDNSKLFFKLSGSVMLDKLKVPTPLVTAGAGGGGGGASFPDGAGPKLPAGGAAGLGDIFSGIKAGAIRFLNFLTYFEMKERAGTVGRNGVGPLLDHLADSATRVHLIGHSFGGRVVTAAAAGSATDQLKTMSLLQTAFSHNGFSLSMKGFFREVVDKQRIKGPILVTYTPNDTAVGIAYPTASRLSGTVAAAFGDKNDPFGGLGRNGAQKMEPGEVVAAVNTLLAVGGNYAWQPARFHNLEGSKFIFDPNGGDAHGFVTGKEIAWAISRAIS
jgi:hypothetical protein